jgi:hypothetical protein
MLLVDAMEARIGSLEFWPSYILRNLFAFSPHMPHSLHYLKSICAFFFGNRIPFSLACRFFAACSNHSLHHVSRNFGYLYEIWTKSERRPRQLLPSARLLQFEKPRCRYYDMYEGREKYAEGTNVYGSDSVRPPDIGFVRTGFQTRGVTFLFYICICSFRWLRHTWVPSYLLGRGSYLPIHITPHHLLH